jgi:hypothetical protein
VPFLVSYEGDAGGGTLRLLQCIPIRLGQPAAAAPAR